MPPEVTASQAEFQRRVRELYLPAILRKVTGKGAQYSESSVTPALANFIGPAGALDIPAPFYLMTLATKQWFVIGNWAKANPTAETARKREVFDRIVDVVVYMLLLIFMLQEVFNESLDLFSPAD